VSSYWRPEGVLVFIVGVFQGVQCGCLTRPEPSRKALQKTPDYASR
jgi:hypothetical protein